MSNGFASSTELLPLPVSSGPRLNNAVPSVQSHYRTFNPTTDDSAPVPRIGTLVLAVFAAWTSPLASERQVLTFHTRSGFAPAYMPGAARPGFRATAALIRGEDRTPGFDIAYGISTRHRRFALAR